MSFTFHMHDKKGNETVPFVMPLLATGLSPCQYTAKSAFGYETVSETVHVSLRKSRYTL